MYRVIEVTTYNDGTATAQGMYQYADDTQAIANYHSKMGAAMKNAKVQTELVMVIAENGILWKEKRDYFDRGYIDPETVED